MKLSDEIIQWNYPRNIPFFEIYQNQKLKMSATFRKSPPDVLLGKGVPKICSKFTGEHPRHSVISIKLLCKFIEITLRHGCYPVHLLHIFKRPFPKNTSGGLLLSYTFKDVLVTCFSLWHFREIVDYKTLLPQQLVSVWLLNKHMTDFCKYFRDVNNQKSNLKKYITSRKEAIYPSVSVRNC